VEQLIVAQLAKKFLLSWNPRIHYSVHKSPPPALYPEPDASREVAPLNAVII
jgi:hypothetical protein